MAIKRPTTAETRDTAEQEPPKVQIGVRLRALSVLRNEDGTFTVFVAGRKLDDHEQEFLHRMFPNTMDQVHNLLDKEALLAAILEV